MKSDKLPNGTKIVTPFKTLHNSRHYQADIGNSPTQYEGTVIDAYQYEGKGPEYFYTVDFGTCKKYGLSRDKLEVKK